MKIKTAFVSFISLFFLILFTGCSSSSQKESKLTHAKILQSGVDVLVRSSEVLKYYTSGDTVMLSKSDMDENWKISSGSNIIKDTYAYKKTFMRAVLLSEKENRDVALVKVSGFPAMVVVKDKKMTYFEIGDTVIVARNENNGNIFLANRLMSKNEFANGNVFISPVRYWLGVVGKKNM